MTFTTDQMLSAINEACQQERERCVKALFDINPLKLRARIRKKEFKLEPAVEGVMYAIGVIKELR